MKLDMASSPVPADLDDVVVTLVPESWCATRLVRAVGRRHLVAGMVVVGWCGAQELRLVRGRDADRLVRVADLVAAILRPFGDTGSRRHPLTLTNVPDGHRLFDEVVGGRKIVVVELVPPGPAAVQRWLRVLAGTAEPVQEGAAVPVGRYACGLKEQDRSHTYPT
jgi:hypothetical protein